MSQLIHKTIESLFVYFAEIDLWAEYSISIKVRDKTKKGVGLQASLVWCSDNDKLVNPARISGDFDTFSDAFMFVASNLKKFGGEFVQMSSNRCSDKVL